MHISGCFDNENGAPVPGGVATEDVVSNRGKSSAMKNEEESELVASDHICNRGSCGTQTIPKVIHFGL